jgi:gliding motility-associated-like protein
MNKHLSKITLLILGFTLAISHGYSQREGNIWYFGQYAGLDFNSGNPKAITNSSMFQYEGCASISDSNGKILFYTNGITVWDKTHNIMRNGTGLNGGFSSTQSSVIVQRPKSNDIYYIFTVDEVAGPQGFCYSVVDMSKNSGNGEVVTKNVLLKKPTTEKVTAVSHRNEKNVWVITHGWENRSFYAYLVDSAGIDTNNMVQTDTGYMHNGSLSRASGYMKASPDGSKLALAVQNYNGIVEIVDFDDSTGQFSNPITINTINDPYGIEFSPDGTKLYVSSRSLGNIYQFNLAAGSANDIINSKILIGSSSSQVGALQIALNGKIYVARNAGYLGVIENPNTSGAGSDYIDNGIFLKGKNSKFGLPTFNQSYFYNPDFYFEGLCYGDTTKFYIYNNSFIDSVLWAFGDFNSGSDNYSNTINSYHIYTAPGAYELNLLVYHQGLIDTVNWTVPIHPKPNVDFMISDSSQCLENNAFVFINQSSIFTGSMTHQWSFGDIGVSTDESPTYIYTAADTFNVMLVSTTDMGCMDTIIKKVYVNPMPVADFEMNDSAQCFDKNEYEFNNISSIDYGSMTYNWDFGDTTFSTIANPKHTYIRPDTFNVQLIATSNTGCRDTVEKQTYVHVNPTPVGSFYINDSSQCFNGHSFSFFNQSTIKSGTMYYEWYFGDGDFSVNKDPSHIYDTSGTYTVELIAISGFGCKGKMRKNVLVNPMPISSFSINNDKQCLYNNNVQFTNTSQIASGTLAHLWDFGDNQTATLVSPTHKYLQFDSFNVKLISTSPFGCQDSAMDKVYIYPMPKVDFSINDEEQCYNGNSFVFTNTTNIDDGNVDYFLWNLGDGDTSSKNSLTHSYANSDRYFVKLLAVSDKKCRDSMVQQVIVNPNPLARFNINDLTQCLESNSFRFSDSSEISEGAIVSYDWDMDDGNTMFIPKFNYSYTTDDTFFVKLVVASDLNCYDSMIKGVIVYPKPSPSFGINDSTQCLKGNSFKFTNTSTINSGSINSYEWGLGDGNTSTSAIVTHTYSYYQTFPVTLKAISDFGCVGETSRNAYVYPMPAVNFNIDNDAQCLDGNSFSFTNISTIPEGSIDNYYWNFRDGNTSSTENPSHSFSKDKTYYIRLTAYSNQNCIDSAEKKIVVHPMPNAGFYFTQPCLDQNTSFFDSTKINNPDNIVSWFYEFKTGDNASTKSPVYVFTSPGVYKIKQTVVSNNGCPDTAYQNIKVSEKVLKNTLKRVTVTKDEGILIEWSKTFKGSPRAYIVERSDDGLSYEIIHEAGVNDSNFIDKKVDVQNTSYYYRVRVADSCNYITEPTNIGKSILLHIDSQNEFPELSWTEYVDWQTAGVQNYEVKFLNEGSQIFETVVQTPPTQFNFTDDQTNVLQDNYCYVVEAKKNGEELRSTSNEVCISVPLLVFPPNAFTPNGDEVNDVFLPVGKYITKFQMTIFDAWGQKLFYTDDLENGWDGTFKGQDCALGTYIYVIFAEGTKGQIRKMTGTIQLVR